jgi:pseudomonalisin
MTSPDRARWEIVPVRPAFFTAGVRKRLYPALLAILILALVPATPRAQVPDAAIGPSASRDPLSVFPRDRLTRPIDNSVTVTLPGNVSPKARAKFDAGPAPGALPMSCMILALKRDPEQVAALETLAAAQTDPRSTRYHQWLTPATFGEHFGASQHDLDLVVAWLKNAGFTIDDVTSAHWVIVFSGTVAQINSTFHTTIHYYETDGELHRANATDPAIPEALADVIEGVAGLNDFHPRSFPRSLRSLKTRTQKVSGPNLLAFYGAYLLAPSDFATIYNLNPLYNSGITGSGVDIAVIEPCTVDLSVVQTYWGYFDGTSNGIYSENFGTPAACVSSSTDDTLGESFLDLEWAGSVARQANIWLVASGSTESQIEAIQGVLNNPLAGTSRYPSVITLSYGACELHLEITTTEIWNKTWQQAATQGITALVSAGDSGAAGCDDPDTEVTAIDGLGVNGICSSPYSVCVGGTEFNGDAANPSQYWSPQGSALSYIPEAAWNESGANGGSGLWASGGGYSILWTRPNWQPGSNPNRGVPDVALAAAAGHDPYVVCLVAQCPSQSSEYGGTSAAAPSFAGIVALLVQETGAFQGNLNPGLYALASRSDVGLVFHDITSGNNSVPGQTGYTAGPGWDPVTGLGSVDANALVTHWADAFKPEVMLSSPSLSFPIQAVGTVSASQTITLTNFGIAANPSGNYDTLPILTNPATLSVTSVTITGVNPSDFIATTTCVGSPLSAGSNCTITLTFMPTGPGARIAQVSISDNAPDSPQLITLTGMGPSAPPTVPANGVVEGAGFSARIAAGGIGSIFGTNLAAATLSAGGLPLPVALGGASVTMNGYNCGLFFVSTTQINFQVPWELQTATSASLTVTGAGGTSSIITVLISAAAPGIFTISGIAGLGNQAAAQIANTSTFVAPVGSIPGQMSRPATAGEYITVYTSGLGRVYNTPADGAAAGSGGALAQVSGAVSVTIGGMMAPVSFAGLSPGFVGLYQVNVQIPSGLGANSGVPVVVTTANLSSNTATIAVQ